MSYSAFSSKIIELLKSKGTGFEIHSPFRIKGASGAEHLFDAEIKLPNSKSVAIQIVSAEDADEAVIIRTRVMAFDAEIKDVLVIAEGTLAAEAKLLVKLYDFKVVEAEDAISAVEKLLSVLVRMN